MKTVINELKEAYRINNQFNRIDCSDDVIEPEYELLDAIQTVLEYYMTSEELAEWNRNKGELA